MTGGRRPAVLFIDELSLISWCFHVLPHLLYRRMRRTLASRTVHFFEASRPGRLAAGCTAWMAGVKVEQLQFRMADIQDEDGTMMWLSIRYGGSMARVTDAIVANPLFRDFVRQGAVTGRVATYLFRELAMTEQAYESRKTTVGFALYLVRIARWKMQQWGRGGESGVLFLAQRPWMPPVRDYAVEHGIEIRPLAVWDLFSVARLKLNAIALLPPRVKAWGRKLRDFLYWARIASVGEAMRQVVGSGPRQSESGGAAGGNGNTPYKLAINYYGHLNLDRRELYSDLFFCDASRQLRADDMVVVFGNPNDGLDRGKFDRLAERGIAAVAMSPIAATEPDLPVFFPWGRRGSRALPSNLKSGRGREWRQLSRRVADYNISYDFWVEFFRRQGVRCYTTWYRYGSEHCAMADALAELGGVLAIYQRSAELLPAPELAISPDIFFGFSQTAAAFERDSNSTIPYYVVTGYQGDHRFPLLRRQAEQVRDKLRAAGARHIIAYFDEGSLADDRWHTGHSFMRENYRFLLEKIIADESLGLVCKPKSPGSLEERLGDVAALLRAAEDSGRCFVYREGAAHGAFPPAGAALAADVAIHGHLCAATAGVEAALAGVPTLLLDREGLPGCYLYELGRGNAVFPDWDELWSRCMEHWSADGGDGPFGDWSPVLDKIDPFRDGRGAERMGDYLKWVLDGINSGAGRDAALADAAERYCRAWGQDKVIEVRPRLAIKCQ